MTPADLFQLLAERDRIIENLRAKLAKLTNIVLKDYEFRLCATCAAVEPESDCYYSDDKHYYCVECAEAAKAADAKADVEREEYEDSREEAYKQAKGE